MTVMAHTIPVDRLAEAVMAGLEEYAGLAADGLKRAVRKTANAARADIQGAAPRDTGAYAKSWSVKTTRETSGSLQMTVYSRNRYQLAHLLEYGHAKRGGGRVSGRPHIAPAEDRATAMLEQEIGRELKG